jgi:hypothetical protein
MNRPDDGLLEGIDDDPAKAPVALIVGVVVLEAALILAALLI